MKIENKFIHFYDIIYFILLLTIFKLEKDRTAESKPSFFIARHVYGKFVTSVCFVSASGLIGNISVLLA